MFDVDLTRVDWRKSSYSGGGNDCVEVALGSSAAAVRDSKDPEGGALVVSADGWRDLLRAARDGSLRP